MPCFDKKLEASRNDFYNDIYDTRDVDCVITSGKSLFLSYKIFNFKLNLSKKRSDLVYSVKIIIWFIYLLLTVINYVYTYFFNLFFFKI